MGEVGGTLSTNSDHTRAGATGTSQGEPRCGFSDTGPPRPSGARGNHFVSLARTFSTANQISEFEVTSQMRKNYLTISYFDYPTMCVCVKQLPIPPVYSRTL